MSQPRIPILDLTPEIELLWDDLNAAFQRVLRSGQFIGGPEVEAFEREVADYLGIKHAVGVNSGTDALVIGSLLARAQERCDVVVLDTAPLMAVGDSLPVASVATATVLAVSLQRSNRRQVTTALDVLRPAVPRSRGRGPRMRRPGRGGRVRGMDTMEGRLPARHRLGALRPVAASQQRFALGRRWLTTIPGSTRAPAMIGC